MQGGGARVPAEILRDLAVSKGLPYDVAVDVGGTNTRVSLKFVTDAAVVDLCKFPCSRAKDFCVGIASVVSQLVLCLGRLPGHACFSVGAPVPSVGLRVTFYHWAKDDCVVDFEGLIPLPTVVLVVNDMEAAAFGVMFDLVRKGGDLTAGGEFENVLFRKCGEGEEPLRGSYLVVTLGTGLGVGLLHRLRTPNLLNEAFEVIPTEFSSATMPTSCHFTELSQARHLQREHFKQTEPLMITQLGSSKMIQPLYAFELKRTKFSAKTGPRFAGVKDAPVIPLGPAPKTNAGIAAAAVSGSDSVATRVMYTLYRNVIRAIQQACLMFPGICGVVLAGDNQVSNRPLFLSFVNRLNRRFFKHPRSHLVEKVVGLVQCKSMNLNLNGAFYLAARERVKASIVRSAVSASVESGMRGV